MLDSKDYFKWINDEINRYRNHEWQVAVYASAALGFFTALISDPNRRAAILTLPLWIPTTVILAMTIFCLFVEGYTHKRLNDYRGARRRLRDYPYKTEDAFSAKRMRMTIVDGIYFYSFMVFILFWGWFALHVLFSVNTPTHRLRENPPAFKLVDAPAMEAWPCDGHHSVKREYTQS